MKPGSVGLLLASAGIALCSMVLAADPSPLVLEAKIALGNVSGRIDHLAIDLGRQRFGLGDVVSVATGEAERQWIAKGIDNHVDFRREAAARAADGLVAPPFLRAPALC